MRLIKPFFEILKQEPGIAGIYNFIEICGRTCYKSEDKITSTSAKEFVDRIIKLGHTAMLEHGTVYLKFTDSAVRTSIIDGIKCSKYLYDSYTDNKYSAINSVSHIYNNDWFVTTNYRVLIENGWLDDLQYLCEPTEYHEKRISVRFTCDRGVSHEFVRHRVFSFAQESTRFCNYNKNKFGKELTYIIPSWLEIPEGQSYWKDGIGYRIGANISNGELGFIEKGANYNDFLFTLENAEKSYFRLSEQGWQPQQARAALPNALKTELIMTGFISQWQHFFELRDASSAHPDARALAKPLHEEFIKRGLL